MPAGTHRYMSNSNSMRYQAEAQALRQGDRNLNQMSAATMDMVTSDDPQLLPGIQMARFGHPEHGTATALFEEGFMPTLIERIKEGGCGVCGKQFEHTDESSQFCEECLKGFVPADHPIEDHNRAQLARQVGDSVVRQMRAYQLARQQTNNN